MSKMKYSGVDWIGNVPEEWTVIKTKYLCEKIFAGGTPSTDNMDYWDGDIPWLPSGECQNCNIDKANIFITNLGLKNSSTKMIPCDTTLIAMTGATCANVGYLTFDSCANQSVTAFINKKNILFSKYLFYALLAGRQNILTFQTGGAQAGINVENCKNLYIPKLNFKEQQLIVNFLDDKIGSIDEILADLNKEVKILNDYKQQIIKETVTKGLNKNIDLKDSGVEWIGKIPCHWKITKNKYQIKIHNGKEIENEEGLIPVYGTGGAFKNTDKYLYDGESVLLGRKGTIDNPIYVNCKFWTVDTCYYTTSKGNILMRLFYYFSKCFDYKYYQTGSTLPSMTQLDLGGICIPDIPKNEQKEIVDFLDDKCFQIDKMMENKNKQIEQMEQYKKSVIYEYVTGKKRVEGAEELYG